MSPLLLRRLADTGVHKMIFEVLHPLTTIQRKFESTESTKNYAKYLHILEKER